MFSQLYTEAEKREHKTKRKIIKRERNKEQGSRKGSTQIKDKAAEEIIYIYIYAPLTTHSFLSHTHTLQCSYTRTQRMYNAQRHARSKLLLYPDKPVNTQHAHFLLSELPVNKSMNS